MASDTRQRMIETAAVLMRERGVEAMSFADVIARSGAPRGSIYHHFPAGKAQLVAEATAYAGDWIAAGLATALRGEDPVRAVRAFADGYRDALRVSEVVAGCPVVAAALEGPRAPEARRAAAAAFGRWEELLAGAIVAHGVAGESARGLATLVIAALEGAIVLARAEGSLAPFDRVMEQVTDLLTAALGR